MPSARLSIAGLMGAVVVAALNFAALRYSSSTRAGVAIMLTCGVLALAVVGAVCRAGASRAWWAGFALFGAGYLAVATYLASLLGEFPTIWILERIASKVGASPAIVARQWGPEIDPSYRWVGHCFWALLLGCVGGWFARILFASARAIPDGPFGEARPRSESRRPGWPRSGSLVAMLSICIVATAVAALGSTSELSLWTGATLLLTFAVLGLAVLGVVFGRGRRRAQSLGAALFGLGYLILVALGYPDLQAWPYLLSERVANAAEPMLRRVVRGHAGSSTSVAAANARVYHALGKRVPMRFAEATPLEDVLHDVVEAMRDPDGRRLPVYVHPRTASHEMTHGPTVRAIELGHMPLGRGLRLCLAENDYTYHVAGGILQIADPERTVPADHDGYFIAGHCLTVLVVAGAGGLLGGWVWRGSRAGRAAPSDAKSVSASQSQSMG
jgi:hypothetical protein